MIGETKFQATARLDADGRLRVSVTAVTGYGERSAGVTQDVADKKLTAEVGKLLKEAIRQVQKDLQPESVTAAAEAMVYAARKGEKV